MDPRQLSHIVYWDWWGSKFDLQLLYQCGITHTTVPADPSLRYSCMLRGHLATKNTHMQTLFVSVIPWQQNTQVCYDKVHIKFYSYQLRTMQEDEPNQSGIVFILGLLLLPLQRPQSTSWLFCRFWKGGWHWKTKTKTKTNKQKKKKNPLYNHCSYKRLWLDNSRTNAHVRPDEQQHVFA